MNVIRRLRVHMIVSIVAVLMAVLAVILIVLNVALTHIEKKDILTFVNMIVENGGKMPQPPKDAGDWRDNVGNTDADSGASEVPPPTVMKKMDENALRDNFGLGILHQRLGKRDFRNYVAVLISDDNTVSEVSYQFPFFHSKGEMIRLIGYIMSEHKERGFYNSLFFKITDIANGDRMLVILNCQAELATFHRLYYYSFFVWLVSLLVALVSAWALSGIIVKPVAETLDRQKNFISDAGHELKTPIAVIAANVDVLMPDLPNNRWLQYIKAETERMNRLVKDLLFLARDDAGRRVMQIGSFSLSNAVENAVLPFESIIFEQKKRLEYDVESGLSFVGDEQQIKQVVIILVDNAIKNSEEGAVIRVTMKQEAQKAVIRVFNTGVGIKPEDLHKIFLRFYRSDASRARKTGGYGLGLAIAKAISDAHNGQLSVSSNYGEWAEFTFALPLLQHKESKKQQV